MILMATAFTFCGTLIVRGIQENDRFPIATTVKTELVSEFPFPTLTFQPKSENKLSNNWNALLRVLDFLTFDCTAVGYEPHDAEAQRECLERKEKVDEYILPWARNDYSVYAMWAHISSALPKEQKELVSVAYSLICDPHIQIHKELRNTFLTLLKIKDVSSLSVMLRRAIRHFFLEPYAQMVENLTAQTAALAQTNGVSPVNLHISLRTQCYLSLKKAQISALRLISEMALSIGHPDKVLTLGWFLQAINFNRAAIMNFANMPDARELFYKPFFQALNKMGHYDLSTKAITEIMTCLLVKCPINSTVLEDERAKKFLFDLHVLKNDQMVNDIDFFHKLANFFVNEVGLDEKVVLPKTHSNLPPKAWHCQLDNELADPCFPLSIGFTSHGIGSILNGGRWTDHFPQSPPLFNAFVPNDEMISKLNAPTNNFFINFVIFLRKYDKFKLCNIFCNISAKCVIL
jgi:hypothetical protein